MSIQAASRTASSHLPRDTRLAALRTLAGEHGDHLDIAVILGLATDDGAELLDRVLRPAATPRDPAGRASCGRTSQRGCGICWARTWREAQA